MRFFHLNFLNEQGTLAQKIYNVHTIFCQFFDVKNGGYFQQPSILAECAPPPSAPFCRGGGGVEPPTKFSKRAGLTGPQLLEGGYWERGGDFFQGEVAIFT